MDVFGTFEVRWAQGFTSQKVEFVDMETACYSCGNFIIFMDMETKKRSVLQGPGRGIGAFTANGHSKTLAFSEHKLEPSVFVYSYPELTLKSELRGTAKLEYASLALSNAGPYLACCSSIPDHTLAIWNWESGVQICSKPLARREIAGLAFNPVNWLQLCAISATSVIVWNVERCDKLHIIKSSEISLPASDGSTIETKAAPPHGSNGKLTYYGPQMPTLAIAGLTGDEAENFVPKELERTRLHPSAICWTASSDLYVGCREGHLLQVNPDSQAVSILSDPRQECAPAGLTVEGKPHLQEGSLQSMVLHRDGLFAAGNEGILRCMRVKEKRVEVTQCWDVKEPITNISFSPECKTLLLSSATGCVYRYQSSQPEKVTRVLDVLVGDIVAAAHLYIDKGLCVSVRDSGELQLWTIDTGSCVGSTALRVQVTSLASCPVAQCVAVGTASGHVLFVDLTQTQHPRVVHQLHLYHVPVEHLKYDQGGNFLVTAASESHLFFLDARPSKMFQIIGYTEAGGAVVDLSTQYVRESRLVKVLALCAETKEGGLSEGSRLTMLCLPIQKLTGEKECADLRGCLPDDLLQKHLYELPQPLFSAVLGPGDKIFGYCNTNKTLQQFLMPESTGSVQLTPEQEMEGHPLGPATLLLSPHQRWLASVGKDGLLRLRDISSMDRCLQIQCHSCWLGGARTVSFTSDSQTLVTTGSQDGSLVCVQLRLKMADTGMADAATQYGQTMAAALEPLLASENATLSQMPEWDSTPVTVYLHGEEVLSLASEKPWGIDVTEQDESFSSLPSVSAMDLTWLDKKLEEAVKQESQQFAESKRSLKKGIKQLRETIQAMMRENEALPDIEKLDHLEFNLDVEEQKRLQAEGEEEVARVRHEIEMENLAKRYLREVLKRECWDSMEVKGQSVKAFHSDHEVRNYPMKERTQGELEELQRVKSTRAIEQADYCLQQDILERTTKPPAEKEEDEDEDEDGGGMESHALAGSLSALYGGSNPYLYSQFELHTREQKINQITLLQDVIYQVKTAFNKEFESVFKQKEQEMGRIRDKNRRMTEIMGELDLKEPLWEPTLSDDERPERALSVEDSEIKVEKYLTPEQKLKDEEQKKAEEQRRLAAKGDNIRERALDDMMSGLLELKKEDILKMEVPQPEFMTRPEEQRTEEEKKISKEYEKKARELAVEQEKYRKTLEAEMKKLQTSIRDATQGFDGILTRLFERKVKSEMVIYQEELKITNMVHSILIEEEILTREKQLHHKLEKTKNLKSEIAEEVKSYREHVDAFRETYDNAVAEDKLLDRGFRKEFFDVPGHLVDQLYKLYKRRPRVQRLRTQADNSSLFKERPWSGRTTGEGLSSLMEAMNELDGPECAPEGLDPAVWERFCLVRRTKVESEQQVKQRALNLAEMQAFLQRRMEEDETARLEMKSIIDDLSSLQDEKLRFRMDIMVQILLKQGQVEVETGDFIADFSNSLLIHRNVVEDLNGTIRVLGEQKIATMVKCKDFRKGIIQQEWEHKRMAMQMEDLNNKARDIQMLRVSQELQEYLSEMDPDSRMSKQATTLEKNITLQEKIQKKNVKKAKALIKQLNKEAALRAEKNAMLDRELDLLQVSLTERRRVYEATAMEKNQESRTAKRYQEILERKKLLELVKAQAHEAASLRAELERLRNKNFPVLALHSPK